MALLSELVYTHHGEDGKPSMTDEDSSDPQRSLNAAQEMSRKPSTRLQADARHILVPIDEDDEVLSVKHSDPLESLASKPSSEGQSRLKRVQNRFLSFLHVEIRNLEYFPFLLFIADLTLHPRHGVGSDLCPNTLLPDKLHVCMSVS